MHFQKGHPELGDIPLRALQLHASATHQVPFDINISKVSSMVEIKHGPVFKCRLTCQPLYLLSEPIYFRINLACELEFQEPVTVLVKGSIFDPAALYNGCIRLIDVESGERLALSNSAQCGQIAAREFLIFEPGREQMFVWSTDKHSCLPRWAHDSCIQPR